MYKKGFTLVETLVAIGIMMLAIAVPISISGDSVAQAYYARTQLAAFFLAQEGLEAARTLRDNEALLSPPVWMRDDGSVFRTSGCFVLGGADTQKCTVDVSPAAPDPTLTICPVLGCPVLNAEANSDLYTHGVGTPTIFTRYLRFKELSPRDVRVMSVVSWPVGQTTRTITLTTDLMKWQIQ